MATFVVSRIKKTNDTGKLIAYCSVQDEDIGIEFRDLRLFEGSNGRFIKFPERLYEKDGKDAYAAYVSAIWNDKEIDETGKAYLEDMAEAASAAYDDAPDEEPRRTSSSKASRGGGGSSRTASRSSTKSSRPAATKSGRGPVKSGDRKVEW